MEFHITLSGSIPDLDGIEDAFRTLDPSALVDIDSTGHTLRVAASVDEDQLVALMARAAYPVARHQIHQVPSICCGGCSG